MADLIYDLGANNGDDTAFYLAKGFDVVSVDADPDLCTNLKRRFAIEVSNGRCLVINCGVGRKRETMTFYRNPHSDWSSFLKAGKATVGGRYETIEVNVKPLSDLLNEHGTPYYLKIDIEGYELPALEGADLARHRPQYLSFEVNTEWRPILTLLTSHGYRRFQIVRQGQIFLPPLPAPAREGLSVPFAFTNQSSGPFGRDLPEGGWLDEDALHIRVLAELEARRERSARGDGPGWHDIHCTLD